MKKRIIALILVVVMAVSLLASCGAYNFAEEDLSGYVTFNYDKLIEALNNIEIEDGDYTTDEDTRKKKVEENILAAIAKTVIANAANFEEDKLETGAVNTERDVLYFCYYATDADGNVFYYTNMKESSITASTTKTMHVLQLADYADGEEVDEDASANDKLLAAMAKAVIESGFDFGSEEAKNGYGMLVSSDFESTTDRAVAIGDTIVVSYTREYNIYETDENGEYVLDENGNKKIEKTKKETAVFEKITVGDTDTTNAKLAAYIKGLIEENEKGGVGADSEGKNGKKNTVNVGATIVHPTSSSSANKKLEVADQVTVTEGEGDDATEKVIDVTYTYSDVKIEWKVDDKYAGKEITFKHTPYTTTQNVQPDNAYTTSQKVDLKNKELTYHVLPVYYLSVPAISAESIVRYALADKVSADSFEIFTSEEYKNSDETVKALVEELVKLYDEDYAEGSDLAAKLKAFEDAEKALKDAGDDYTDEQEEAVETAEKAYLTAQRAAIADAVKKIVDAKKGEETVASVIVEKHKEETAHTLREAYDDDITKRIEEKVYEIIFKNDEVAKVTSYPESLVKDFTKHIYDSYEAKFYNEDYKAEGSTTSSGVSNYLQYKGDLNAYLLVATGATAKFNGNIDAAIEAEAKDAIAPLLKLYAVAKALDEKGVSAKVVEYIQNDIDKHAYDANYTYDDKLSQKENEKAEKKANEQALENQAEALKNAEKFLVTDEVYKAYKKALGSTASRQYEDSYGEINIRAALQFNRLFYYLASPWLEHTEDDEHPHTEYKTVTVDGKATKVLHFRNLNYVIVEDEDADEKED